MDGETSGGDWGPSLDEAWGPYQQPQYGDSTSAAGWGTTTTDGQLFNWGV